MVHPHKMCINLCYSVYTMVINDDPKNNNLQKETKLFISTEKEVWTGHYIFDNDTTYVIGITV